MISGKGIEDEEEIHELNPPVGMAVERVLGLTGRLTIRGYKNVGGYRNHGGYLEIYQVGEDNTLMLSALIPQFSVAGIEIINQKQITDGNE